MLVKIYKESMSKMISLAVAGSKKIGFGKALVNMSSTVGLNTLNLK